MPTTLSGLLLFVVLLLPGLAYVVRLERGPRPGKGAITAFRETVTVVVASVLALGLVLLLFTLARVLLPGHTPDVGRLVRAGRGDYLRAEYDYVGWWSALLLVLAVVVAYLAARFDVARWLEEKVLREPEGGKRPQSAWYRVFEEERAKDRNKYLICRLSDGTEIEGGLTSYNPSADETANRALVIGAPYVVHRSTRERRRFDVGVIVVSASELVWVRVEYVTDNELEYLVSMSIEESRSTSGGT